MNTDTSNTAPNLLFIFTDEQSAATLSAYGNDRIRMPNLDALAAQSVVFEKAYVTQPVCTPSRSTLMTGLWPHTNGCTENNVPLRPETPCLPEMLSPGVYTSAYHGKWHLGDEIFRQHGFDEWRSIDDGYAAYYGPDRDPAARSSYHAWLTAHGRKPANGDRFTRGEVARLPEALSKPAHLAEEGSRFIREHAGRPFCLVVNFFEPHMPFTGPRDDQYDRDSIPLPPNFTYPVDSHRKHRLFAEAYRAAGQSGPLTTPAEWRDLIARYWGLCSQVDTHCGTILEALRDSGQWDNTIIVFTSDHGDMMGAHHLVAKCVMYEEAVTVPLLLKLPGQRAGRRIAGPVSHIDVLPTLLDLMGQPVPSSLQGASLKPLLDSGLSRAQRDVFIEWNGGNNGFGDVRGAVQVPKAMLALAEREEIIAAITDPIRTVVTIDGWKLNWSARGDNELFDLNADPHELRNLAGEPGQANRIREMAGRLRAWQERTADTAPRVAQIR
jgi:arylsulfatase A-like enzyme